jgi:carboxyl-terminal processing protease
VVRTLLKIGGVVVASVLIALTAFSAGMMVGRADVPEPTQLPGTVGDAVDEVMGIVDRTALVPADETSATVGAVVGVLNSLDDPHAAYFNVDHFQYLSEQNAGEFFGIGVTIGNRDDDLVVMSVMPNTPAERAGLAPEDVIVEIDGETRMRWDVDEAVTRIRGEEGSTIKLSIRREGADGLIEFSIVRTRIELPNIESELIDGTVGYIRLLSFNHQSDDDVREAITDLSAEGAAGFILDLRDNPGGLLSSSVDVSSLFIADGVIVRVEDRTGTIEEYWASGEVATAAPLVVLINGNSASASEIVAGALQDYSRATLVGETSFGKGSVQQLEELSFGGAIKLTIAEYVTPKGRTIDRLGLTPDVEVLMEHGDQAERETDIQLQRAIEVLKEEL